MSILVAQETYLETSDGVWTNPAWYFGAVYVPAYTVNSDLIEMITPSVVGDISTKNFYMEVFNIDQITGNMTSSLGTSALVPGNNAWSYSWIPFVFSPAITLLVGIKYAIIVRTTVAADGANSISWGRRFSFPSHLAITLHYWNMPYGVAGAYGGGYGSYYPNIKVYREYVTVPASYLYVVKYDPGGGLPAEVQKVDMASNTLSGTLIFNPTDQDAVNYQNSSCGDYGFIATPALAVPE